MEKSAPGATGAILFFIPVLRVRRPLRIWLLPDSERATGNLLTRDDSDQKFRVLLGRSLTAALGLAAFPQWPQREGAVGSLEWGLM